MRKKVRYEAAPVLLVLSALSGCSSSEPASTPSEGGVADVTMSDTATSGSFDAPGSDAPASDGPGVDGETIDAAAAEASTDGATEGGMMEGGMTDGGRGDASPDAGLPNVIFVSSKPFPGGSLGGLAGADALCLLLATKAKLPGTFIDYLSTSSQSASNRAAGARGWVRSDG